MLGIRKGLIVIYRNDKGIEIGRPTWIFIVSLVNILQYINFP